MEEGRVSKPEDDHWVDPEWESLPKGNRMFCADFDPGTQSTRGEEIISLCKETGVSASIADDLIAAHGYIRALDLTRTAQRRAEELAHPLVVLEAEGRERGGLLLDGVPVAYKHAGVEQRPATVRDDTRCNARCLVPDGGTTDTGTLARCYLLENHGGLHRTWAQPLGEFTWDATESG